MLHGPGDVIGLDPNQIVRVSPRAHTTNAEPNYLAAVDLDAPELPWLFTPYGVPSTNQLAPWLVLVVVEDRAGVGITLPTGAPLPQLRIESGAKAELPNLADSWAWSHVQLVEPDGGSIDVATTLGQQPDRNVARLVCPRRLAPNRRWIAALVPAFDAGVARGLGGKPAADAPLGPAWTDQDTVTLPVYFHWEFQTGLEGDFESLAQRIKPYRVANTVGYVPMHVGEASPAVRVPPEQPRHMAMDGALRALAGADGTLAQVPSALADGLAQLSRTLVDAADGVIDGQQLVDASHQPVGPPIYGSSHIRRWQVKPEDPPWFRELNLDPRPRVAAGLAAECVRANQEEIAHAAWRQVGDVLTAEAALQRAALAQMVALSFHKRHLEPMGADRLLELVAPMAPRTPVAGKSLALQVAESSLPDAVLDAGLRRALAPSGRAASRAARRLGTPVSQLRMGLVASLAKGRTDVDPTRFARPALTGVPAEAFVGVSDLAPIGLAAVVGQAATTQLAASASALATTAVPQGAERLGPRPGLAETGLLGQSHIDALRELSAAGQREVLTAMSAGATVDVTTVSAISTGSMIDALFVASEAHVGQPNGGAGVGLVLEGPQLAAHTAALVRPGSPVSVGVLDLDHGGILVVRTPSGQRNTPVARVDSNLAGADLGAVLARLPAGVLRMSAMPAAPNLDNLPLVSGPGSVDPASANVRTSGAGVRVAPGLAVNPAGLVLPTGRDSTDRVRGSVGVPGPIPGPVATPAPIVATPEGAAAGGQEGPRVVVAPPLLTSVEVINRFSLAAEAALLNTVLGLPSPTATLVPFDLTGTAAAVRHRLDPSISQPLRRDALVSLGGVAVGDLTDLDLARTVLKERLGWWVTPSVDRIMAYPTFPVPAYRYLTKYDRTRFCPGIDEIPPDSVSLLETNPRFISAFMAGLNHETNRELLWRRYPTDCRGTPFRQFWARLDGKEDIPPIHGWRGGSLAQQSVDKRGNLVLILRGELLRRYPNTIVVAVRAKGQREPSRDPADVLHPVFAGGIMPDVSFFGFELVDTDLAAGSGWFFALMEPVTEPRFGLDETKSRGTAPAAKAWADTGVDPGGYLGRDKFSTLALNPSAIAADRMAETLFQKPFALFVHAKHLVKPLPAQR
ncbi:hypothetical protein [Arthrobacter sp. OAP107]|uniref:hypothetical protein n=1 Tax=Arthrobacter sp. OAP107 TaxID=3156445 RepID=UPI00339B6059